jgi:hypothetical protein
MTCDVLDDSEHPGPGAGIPLPEPQDRNVIEQANRSQAPPRLWIDPSKVSRRAWRRHGPTLSKFVTRRIGHRTRAGPPLVVPDQPGSC